MSPLITCFASGAAEREEIAVHSAVAVTRTGSVWRAADVDLEDVDTLDDLVDELDDFDADADEQDVTVVFVEEDDEWLGLLRVTVDTLRDPRVFLSDSRVLATSALAEKLFADALPVLAPEPDDDDDDSSTRPDAQPVGDPEILGDLGTPGDVLVELCAEEGLLPGDVVATLCERAGCLDVLDELRGA